MLFQVLSCSTQTWWGPPDEQQKCSPFRYPALQKHDFWKQTFGSQSAQAYGCLQLAWGQTTLQGLTQLVKISSTGKVLAYNPTNDTFDSSPKLSLPSIAKDASIRRFRLFVMGTDVSEPSKRPKERCSGTMKKPGYTCLEQRSEECWFFIEFRPKVPQTSRSDSPITFSTSTCQLSIRSWGTDERAREEAPELLSETQDAAETSPRETRKELGEEPNQMLEKVTLPPDEVYPPEKALPEPDLAMESKPEAFPEEPVPEPIYQRCGASLCKCTGTAPCRASCPNGGCQVECQQNITCDTLCTTGNCRVGCQNAGRCETFCTKGRCIVACQRAKECNTICTGGSCTIDCGLSNKCTVGCTGGNCNVVCRSSCEVICTARNCTVTCYNGQRAQPSGGVYTCPKKP